jgi:hypothetical protein
VKQHLAIADLLAASAATGQLVSGGKVLTTIRKAGGITYARDFSVPLLKYYQN